MYYKMLINWTSQKVKETYATRNPFDFKNGIHLSYLSIGELELSLTLFDGIKLVNGVPKILICILRLIVQSLLASHLLLFDLVVRNFDRSMINDPGPCVLFATPGMISGGFSLEVFKSWAPSELNLVTLPG